MSDDAIKAAKRAFDNSYCAGLTLGECLDEALKNYKAYISEIEDFIRDFIAGSSQGHALYNSRGDKLWRTLHPLNLTELAKELLIKQQVIKAKENDRIKELEAWNNILRKHICHLEGCEDFDFDAAFLSEIKNNLENKQ